MIKLIEPTYGRLVTLQVLEEEPLLNMYIGIITAGVDSKKVKADVSANTVTLVFPDVDSADAYKAGLNVDISCPVFATKNVNNYINEKLEEAKKKVDKKFK